MRADPTAALTLALALLASPAWADTDPDLGLEMVAPPGASATEPAAPPPAEAEETAAPPAPAAAEQPPAPPAPAAAEQPPAPAAPESPAPPALPPAAAETAAPSQAVTPPPAGASIERATFTTSVVDREPQDSITRLAADRSQVLYFTELHGFQGRSVKHRWEYGGDVLAEVSFAVGGPRWRVHSAKNLLPGWLGEWTVSVVDESGQVLVSQSFEYVAPEAPDPQVAQPPAAAAEPEPPSEQRPAEGP
jgi:hypothetical protein